MATLYVTTDLFEAEELIEETDVNQKKYMIMKKLDYKRGLT
jgi:hypothetical protein|tara:strand:+ start:1629 stop:1751 length:123 start_codon:yes stop_codon:yes gene_type:complete